MRNLALAALLLLMFATACRLAGAGQEPAALRPTPTLDMDDPLVQDAASFAEAEGLSIEEGVRRMRFQETIGDVQPLLQDELGDVYAGLWVEHQPQYQIVIALTAGDEETVARFIEDKEWAEYVTVQQVTHSLADLLAAQQELNQALDKLNVSAATAVDIRNNRVELIVGNPELLRADLAAAGITLPEAVVILPIDEAQPLPPSNEGALLTGETASGRTIYLPQLPPAPSEMAALLEGELVEVDGCLRVRAEGYDEGFLVLWPYGSGLAIDGEAIAVLDGRGQPVAQVGQAIRFGGGAMESASTMAAFDELIPGLPLQECPGPYWIAGQIVNDAE